MPYAWTQNSSLSQNGYDNPVNSYFCYIGFENMSKMVTASFEGHPTNNYGDFIRRFYYHALINQYSIIRSLNEATKEMGVGMNTFNAIGNDLYWGWDEYAQG